MTIDQVHAAIAAIRRDDGDWESTHGDSDALWEAVLRSIADGTAEDPAALARAAVDGINELDFTRWYA